MAVAYRILGQQVANGSIQSLCGNGTPSAGSQVISTVIICNRAASQKTFRVAVRPNGTTLANQHYLAYDTPVPANDTIIMTLGITLSSSEVVEVLGSDSNVSFSAFGSVIT